MAVISLPKIVPKARSVLPTSSVTVLGFGSAESKFFLNFFISTFMSGVFSSWKL